MAYQNDRIKQIPAPLPVDYDRQTNFTDYQTANPGQPMSGAALDAEFNVIEQALDETQARQRLIQRDDGALQNGIVSRDSLAEEVIAGVNSPTLWTVSTVYAETDSVIVYNEPGQVDPAWYVCEIGHTAVDFAADLAAGRWRLLVDLGTLLADAGQTVVVSGSGSETFTDALNGRPIVFDNEAAMIAQTALIEGLTVVTLGKTTPGDGEGQTFQIVASGGDVTLDNGNEALIVSKVKTASGASQTLATALDDRVVRVGSVAGLADVEILGVTEEIRISLVSYQPGYAALADYTPQGGGELYWNPDTPKSEHDGGNIFSPTVPWTTTLSDYLAGTGETDPTGNGCFVRVRKSPKLFNVLEFGAKGEGDTFDDSPAFAKIASIVGDGDDVEAPAARVWYHVGGITWPVGANLRGVGRRRFYDVSTSTDLTGTGAILWNQTYSNFIDWGGANQVSDINFDGRDRTINGVSNVPGQLVNAMQFFRVSMTRFDRGFGTALTLNNSRLYFCHANKNNNGLYNLVDSHVTNCEINANLFDGVNAQAGANDTVYMGNKVEFNTRNNWRFFDNVSNVIIGGVCDRAGQAGFHINDAEVQIDSVKTRRNGRFVLGANDCAHYFIEGADAKVLVSNPGTSVGADDGGGGDVTPDYTFALRGSTVGELVVVGGSAEGANVAGYSAFNEPTKVSIRSCTGITDLSNLPYNGAEDGVSFIDNEVIGSLATTATTQIVIDNPPISTNSRQERKLTMVARNAGTGGTYSGELAYVVRREGASASLIGPFDIYESAAGAFGDAGTDSVQVELNAIDTDAATITLDVTNNEASTLSIEFFWK